MERCQCFELVRDPWLPLVYTGIIMMMAGVICLFVRAQKRKEEDKAGVGNILYYLHSRTGLLGFGSFCCLERYKTGWAYVIYFLRSGYFLQFHYRNVDFIRTSSDATMGETRLWCFLPSVGGD